MATSSSKQTRQSAASTATPDGALLMHQITRGQDSCPLCTMPLVNEPRHVGGRGWVSFRVCMATGCGFVQEVKR